ncbi:MAG: IS5 family transposase [Rhodobacteraceae bacterium]|nr:IS5 family transposase [Paracoccaceae bacterium]
MSSCSPTKYQTKNWPSYNAALKRRGSLSIWFDPGMVWTPPPTGKRGRRQEFSDAAIQTCLTLKVLFGLPLRQTTGFVESLLRLVELDWAVPDFSTLCRRQKTLNVSLPYRGGTGPLSLLIDSTGIKSEGEGEGEGEWNARKHGGPKRRIWRKIHIGIDEETLEVRAIEVTTSTVGDAPMLPELLNQIPPDQPLGTVTADRAYDTRKCHDAIAARGANAVIPPRKNAKPWKHTSAGAIARNDAVDASRYLGRTLWKRWSGYHRRSRVETNMHCIKLLGQSLMSRDFHRQVAEIQVRIAVLNRYTALGIPVTVPIG